MPCAQRVYGIPVSPVSSSECKKLVVQAVSVSCTNLAVVMCLSGSPGWFSRNIRYLSIDIVAPKVE